MSDFFFLLETCFHLNFSPTSLKFIVCIQVTCPNIISYRGLPGAFGKFYFPDNKQQQKSPPPLSAFMPRMLTTKRLARWKAASAASVASSFKRAPNNEIQSMYCISCEHSSFLIDVYDCVNPLTETTGPKWRNVLTGPATTLKSQTLEDISCDISRVWVLPVPVPLVTIAAATIKCWDAGRQLGGFYQRGTFKMTWTQRVEVFETSGTAGGSLNSVFFLMCISTVSQ